MKKLIVNTIIIFLSFNILNMSMGDISFFDKGLKLYDEKKYDDAKFMFERGIVFNPKTQTHIYI